MRNTIIQDQMEYKYLEIQSIKELIFNFREFNLDILLELHKQNQLTLEIKEFLSTHSNVDITWIKALPDIKWNFYQISRSSNFDISWVKEYPDANWNWVYISMSPKLCLNWLRENPDNPWDLEIICSHKNFQYDWIEFIVGIGSENRVWDVLGKKRIWDVLSDQKNLELKWIINYLDEPWNWNYLSENGNLTLEWLKTLPSVPWNFQILSYHPKLSLKWLELFPHKNWNFVNIISNSNIVREFKELEMRKYMAIYKIKKWWKKIIYNPKHPVGIKFIGKLYEENFPNQ